MDLRFNFTPSLPRMFFRAFCLVCGIVSIVIWVAFLSERWESVTVWILDTSLSMTTDDLLDTQWVAQSRMDTARALVASGISLVSGRQSLITFSDSARLIVPLTDDQDFLKLSLESLTPHIYWGASDMAKVIELLTSYDSSLTVHAIVLTDGEWSHTPHMLSILPSHVSLTIVGIGTESGGPMLEGYDAFGKPRYKQSAWKTVISRLDRPELETLTSRYSARLFIIDRYSLDQLHDILHDPAVLRPLSRQIFLVAWVVFLLLSISFPFYRLRSHG